MLKQRQPLYGLHYNHKFDMHRAVQVFSMTVFHGLSQHNWTPINTCWIDSTTLEFIHIYTESGKYLTKHERRRKRFFSYCFLNVQRSKNEGSITRSQEDQNALYEILFKE